MESLFLKSIKEGRIRQTGLLLKVGKDVNEQDTNGESGLMKTMILSNSQTRLNIVKMLLRNNADLSLTDAKKRTAFMWACFYGRTDEIKYMIAKRGASSLQIDNQDIDGNTAVLLAVKRGNLTTLRELVRYLQEIGMQSILSVKNNEGISPLMEAFRNGNFDIAKCLLNDGKVKIDDLTHNVLNNHDFKIYWLKATPQKLISHIIENLSEELDPDPSNILRLLITNDSFRNVAIKMQKNKDKKSLHLAPRTAPGRLQNRQVEVEKHRSEGREPYRRQKSIKGMLPIIMNIYEEQRCQNYRPSSKNDFIPYSTVSRQLKTITTTPKASTTTTKSSLLNLPDFGRFKRLSDPRNSRLSRSTSVQLPQVNSWSLLRNRLRTNLINDL